jgi:hypothetical protein
MGVARAYRWALLTVALSCAAPLHAAKLTDTEKTRIDEPRPAGLASDEQMLADGAVIDKIDLDLRQIFDETDRRENNGLYRLANDLHIRTKPSTIQAQLLFKVGDRYDPRKLIETERNLRALRFIYDARVVPVKYENGKVEVKVVTKDVWTLSPGFSVGRSGGANNTRFELEDSNLFGWGKKIQIGHGKNVDRTSDTIDYEDPNLFGSRWTFGAAYANSNDGSDRNLSLGQPFYSLNTPWSVTFKARQYRRTVSRYSRGEIADQFERDEDYYEASGGVSSGLVNGWTKRWTAGVRYDRNVFSQVTTATPAAILPPDRTTAYPFVGINLLQDDFRKVGDQNQIGRTEDLSFGTQLGLELGYSNSAFGASRNAPIVNANALKGFQLTPATQLFLSSTMTTRVEGGQIRNLFLDSVCILRWYDHARDGSGDAAADRWRQWPAGLPAAVSGRHVARLAHRRAALLHRVVSLPPGAVWRGHFRRRGPHLGLGRGWQQQCRHAQ